ncbi:PAS domain-containing sensor histidine kinase [Jatrophihabitans fulvus]
MTVDDDATLALALVSQLVDFSIIRLDPDGVVVTWNAGAELLKGYRADEAVGRHFSMFHTDDDRRDGLPEQLLARARAHGRVEQTGWRVRQDGTLFWGDVVITALHDDSGALTGYAKVTRDRTDQHRLEQLQASLFAALSHDIRHPLTSIGAYASLLPRADEHDRAEYAERILQEAEQLEALITTMFDYAKLRAGAVPISLEPLSLGEAIREFVRTHEPLLSGRDVSIEVDTAVASADRVALRRVLSNLVSNAVKYSPDGSPIHFVTRDMGSWVELSVSDEGRGIAPEDVPVIFTEFVRGRLATDDGGTGLGLSSVRKLVELQGGRVTMSSRVGEGTTVTVVLESAPAA